MEAGLDGVSRALLFCRSHLPSRGTVRYADPSPSLAQGVFAAHIKIKTLGQFINT